MPELPEITSRAREMQSSLVGKVITGFEIIQPKSLNLAEVEFKRNLHGAEIKRVTNRGKWILVETSQGWLCLNLGMGGEILLCSRSSLPPKYRLIFDFSDQTCLAINFWWFGYAHYTRDDPLSCHPTISRVGPNVLDVSLLEFKEVIPKQRTRLKTFLLDQSKFSGIGNAYIHDILFLARLHPLTHCNTLNAQQIEALFTAVHQGLEPSLKKGGAFYEITLFGEKGGFLQKDILIGYRQGQPCPVCQTTIEKIKTGSTSSFICPVCQELPG